MKWGIIILLIVGFLDAVIIHRNTRNVNTKFTSELIILYIAIWFLFGHVLIESPLIFITWGAFLVLTSVYLGHSRHLREKSKKQKNAVQFWASALVAVVGIGALLSMYIYFFKTT